jgi:Holliday junction resolvase RusA-like endonuclease
MITRRYVLEGAPIPLKRPRFSFGQVYDSQKKEKEAIRQILKLQHGHKEPLLKGALKAEITFLMPTPKSYSQKRQLNMEGQHHISKPDIDNLQKFIFDCANDILFDDDSQIYLVIVKKIWSNGDGKTVLELSEVE